MICHDPPIQRVIVVTCDITETSNASQAVNNGRTGILSGLTLGSYWTGLSEQVISIVSNSAFIVHSLP